MTHRDVETVLLVGTDAELTGLVARLVTPGTVQCVASARDALVALTEAPPQRAIVGEPLEPLERTALAATLERRGIVWLAVCQEVGAASSWAAGASAILRAPVSEGALRSAWAGLPGPAGPGTPSLGRPGRALRTRFLERLAGRLEQLHVALQAAERGDMDAASRAETMAHQLAGTAGAYGMSELGALAARMQQRLLSVIVPPTPAPWQELHQLFDAMEALKAATPAPARAAEVPSAAPDTALLAIDDDPDFLARLVQLGQAHGVGIVPAVDRETALACQGDHITGVLLDLRLGPTDPVALARELRHQDPELPIAVISAFDAITDRVTAVEIGISSYLTKPISGQQLVELAHELGRIRDRSHDRILIVDDDPEFLDQLTAVLVEASMSVATRTDPTRVLDALSRHRPDALVLDARMPEISGYEVCQIVRASPEWRDLPILMVTASPTLEARVAAFGAGADDYLTKPLVPAEVLVRLRGRIERARLLRERSERDPLTGLLTRRALGNALEAQLAEQRRREDGQLSLALIDLDRFKQVNDGHGHGAGDRVLAGFGLLLQERFRAADLRGRWGGEEFAVALSGESPATLMMLLRRIAADFARTTFCGDRGERFCVTFSAGVAGYPGDGDELDGLLRSADERLYAAKQAGRDDVYGPEARTRS